MKFIASILIILSLLPIQAQTKIKFEEVDHDFGEIREENGFAQHTFRFINEGTIQSGLPMLKHRVAALLRVGQRRR